MIKIRVKGIKYEVYDVGTHGWFCEELCCYFLKDDSTVIDEEEEAALSHLHTDTFYNDQMSLN